MTLAASRKARGAATQRIVADAWRADGWPYAEPIGAGAPGCDLTGTPGIGVEVKARRDLDLTGWLRQTCKNAGLLVPVLIVRPDGFGPATEADWPGIVPHGILRRLLREAGYGSSPGASGEPPCIR